MDQALTIEELEYLLGNNIRQLRLQRNIDQQALSEQAGVSLTALKNLESGKGATTKTMLRVLRALGKESWVGQLAPTVRISPLSMTKTHATRMRATGKKGMKRGDGT